MVFVFPLPRTIEQVLTRTMALRGRYYLMYSLYYNLRGKLS